MADNIPTTVIKNIPPLKIIPHGNNGNLFELPGQTLTYGDIYIAQEVETRDPIEQETGDKILV